MSTNGWKEIKEMLRSQMLHRLHCKGHISIFHMIPYVSFPGLQKKHISQASESIGQLAHLNYSI